ncbi:MAG: 50S ribosomal protein L17 [Verrucomicrobia bacterium GWC2_42_7]|nr:MAG: 50S ribosomal protein L17 [Verrucomicrobia bacterium GWC2_42_7]
MRHNNHRHQLGVKKEHRIAMVSAMACALIKHGRITTTLAKAKALRPFAERIITLAKKAAATEDKAEKLHYRRLAIARMRDVDAVRILFDERAAEFAKRPGGYTRIYKLIPRVTDAASMGIIELIAASDEGYKKAARKTRARSKKASVPAAETSSKVVEDSKESTATKE